MSRKVGSRFTDSEQVKNIVVILLTLNNSKNFKIILLILNKPKNLVVILLLIVGHACLLDILLISYYLSLSAKIFSCLCSYSWGGSFEMHFLRE